MNSSSFSGYYNPDDCDVNAFQALIEKHTPTSEVPNAIGIEKNIPIYDMAALKTQLLSLPKRRHLMAEWANILRNGAGVVVLKRAITNIKTLDQATACYEKIIEKEKHSFSGGDHFAAAGANDRIWNSLQKLCTEEPETYLHYFACPAIDAISEAWLGPNYQMTAQVNLVHPGGASQQVHRDYHLGFQTADISASYPAHVHQVSPILTLQGAVAHCDMPIESGPTKLLPFSQLYDPGYAAWRRDDFRGLFENHYVQLPLEKGDCLFFNPALFHAAGANNSANVHRMANLLQVSSAFGRAMESIDRDTMCKILYPHLIRAKEMLSPAELHAVITATAEGYSFPTNLDNDPPRGGLAPETQAAFLARALQEELDQANFETHLDRMKTARLP